MKTDFTQDDLWETIHTLGWNVRDDNIVIEIGGTQVSGIYQGEEYNKKWAAQYGDRKYNKDAFIVIKNLSRNDPTRSQPMDRPHVPHHLREPEPAEPPEVVVNMEGGVGGSWEVQKES